MNNQQKQFVVRLNCTELISLQNFSVINPQIIIYQQIGNQWNEKGKTEIQFNQRNPKFSTAIPLSYEFEQQFNIKFEVYHCDQHKKHPIGNTIVSITSLLAAKDQIYFTDILSHNKLIGKILILGEYQRYKCDLVELQITARNLRFKKWCVFQIPPNRPFIKISRQLHDTKQIVEVFTSESIKYPQSQSWPTIKLLARDLCNNDNDNPLIIELNEQINKSNQASIGQLSLSVNQMKDSNQTRFLKDQNQCNKGELQFCCKLTEQPIFEEYIQGGLQLNLMISVDFTDSNLEPSNASSLHYFDQNAKKMSKYEQALRTVSEILIQYDHDKKVPIFGFGFVLPGSDKTEHCYPLNGNREDPEVSELFGIFSTYRNFVGQVKFSGPTLFRPTLQEAMKLARGFKNNGSKKYVILAILTDGQIGDFDGTFENIVDCCELPISIIIIGIGNEDFTNMERLNNNDLKEVDSQGRQATRDLVKFVDFKKFQNDSKILAKEVLSELPDQVVSYMISQGIMPNSIQKSLNGQNGQDYQQYYQNQKVQRQATLKRFLNEDDDIRDKDEGTIITKNYQKPQELSIAEIQIMQNNYNSVQLQQQQQQEQIQQQNNEQPKIQFQGSLSNVLNPLNYVHVGNPMISAVNAELNQKSNQFKQESSQNNQFQQQVQINQIQIHQNQNQNQVNQIFSVIQEQQEKNYSGAVRMVDQSEEHLSLNQNENMSDAQFQQNQARLSQIQNKSKFE